MGSIPSPETTNVDVLVVGAGFSGLYALHRFRELGLKAHIYEAGGDVGGVWYWSRYPGARVDSEWPYYQLSLPQVWRDFSFSQRFPDHTEIRSYFKHMVDVLDLRKDITFDARVNSAEWSEDHSRWSIKSEAGHQATAKYIFLCSGLLHRRHYPDLPEISSYKGIIHHSGFWPEDLDLTGKRVCVIGAGATSVQIVQELAKKASHLTVLMRRPSLCLPLRNRKISEEEQDGWKQFYPALFQQCRLSAGGFPFDPPTKSMFEYSDDERNAYYEELWKAGAFAFAGKNFPDSYTDLKANRIAYDFWAQKTRARISDPKKRNLMAPPEPPYPIMTKRLPLESDYYEMIDRPNVDVEDLNHNPIRCFTEDGISFQDGTETQFDCVVLATGYDSFSGSVATMGLKNKSGRDIKNVWSEGGIATYLGMLIRGFPNCFMSYSPQAPTALSNGPTILECQVDFVVSAIDKLEKEGIRTIEPSQEAQDGWAQMIDEMSKATLFPLTNSWWNGSNIPGKKVQMLTYVGGIKRYEAQCRETLDGWKGFEVQEGKSNGI